MRARLLSTHCVLALERAAKELHAGNPTDGTDRHADKYSDFVSCDGAGSICAAIIDLDCCSFSAYAGGRQGIDHHGFDVGCTLPFNNSRAAPGLGGVVKQMNYHQPAADLDDAKDDHNQDGRDHRQFCNMCGLAFCTLLDAHEISRTSLS